MPVEQAVRIPVAGDREAVWLDGDLVVPPDAGGIVVFAHGSGSSRRSPRNRAVAAGLRGRGLGTLLMDLLTATEEAVDARTGHLRFDVDLLAGRLEEASAWLRDQPDTARLPLGYFGASTGAAAALIAASRDQAIGAVVSRGGRPDLAGEHLGRVRAPTLLIVGGRDDVVLRLNRAAAQQLAGEVSLEIVPGATHLFEEPGALDAVTALAGDWFLRHLVTGTHGGAGPPQEGRR